TRPPGRTTSSWADLDQSIILACVSPIGNWLTGGDYVKSLILFALLIYYLHQVIEVPWKLYQESLPRKPAHPRRTHAEDSNPIIKLAETELHQQEIFLLGFTVFSPFLAAILLYFVLDALGGADSLSWFSTTLFVLAAGIRPWNHLISRLQSRTQALHDAVHYPPDAAAEAEQAARVTARLDAMAAKLQELQTHVVHAEILLEPMESLREAVDQLKLEAKQSERKAKVAREAFEKRVTTLATGLLHLEQSRKIDTDTIMALRAQEAPLYVLAYQRACRYIGPLLAGLRRLPKMMWMPRSQEPGHGKMGNGTADGAVHHNGILKNGNGHMSGIPPRTSARENGSHPGSPRLPTIPEAVHSDSDADSEGTFVSEKEKERESPVMSPVARPREKARRMRSRSRSGSKKMVPPRRHAPLSFGQWALQCAQSVVLWPYLVSVKILKLMLPPPLQRILP
ncbi:uncharacterized protein LAESUDRAFT_613471, partial [Laetiporus sulphureus 93-53]